MTKQILVVDDDAQTRVLIGLMMRRHGYRVAEAFDGQSALRMLEFMTPDLIIVDLMMPGMDGNELCRRARLRERTSDTPIIIFTANVSSRIEHHARQCGANEYLPKTNPPEDLPRLVNGLLGMQTAFHSV